MVLINLRSLSAQRETEKYLFYFILTNKISCCKNIMIIYCVQRLKLAVGLRQICIYDNRAWGPPQNKMWTQISQTIFNWSFCSFVWPTTCGLPSASLGHSCVQSCPLKALKWLFTKRCYSSGTINIIQIWFYIMHSLARVKLLLYDEKNWFVQH